MASRGGVLAAVLATRAVDGMGYSTSALGMSPSPSNGCLGVGFPCVVLAALRLRRKVATPTQKVAWTARITTNVATTAYSHHGRVGDGCWGWVGLLSLA